MEDELCLAYQSLNFVLAEIKFTAMCTRQLVFSTAVVTEHTITLVYSYFIRSIFKLINSEIELFLKFTKSIWRNLNNDCQLLLP